MNRTALRSLLLIIVFSASSACVTSNVDQMVFNEPTEGIGDSSVVILGRRHASDYETEPDFIECVGDHIASRDKSITVIGELEFINALYPWFEPRTAPLHPQDIDRLLQQFFDVCQDQHSTVPGLHGVAANRRHDRGLSATCWDHDNGIIVAITQVLVHCIDCLLLIRSERQHYLNTS